MNVVGLPWLSLGRGQTGLRDLGWLLLLAIVVLGAGLGLRAPWPADEPRFALIALDMLQGGSWWVPHIAGDLYQDKPPLFFWAIAAAWHLTGSLQVAFLLPALLAGLLSVALVWDLARRLWSREVALGAGLLLLATVQFLLQARGAQIDGFLLGLTTLSLYGLARHLLLGPAFGWYALAGLAAGLGVATKGVGFLPLLLLLPWALLRRAGFVMPLAPVGGQPTGGWRWWLAPLGLLLGVAVWLVPMLWVVAQSADPTLIAYRDEILLQQTVHRYAHAWHHQAPPWFFVVNAIPGLWLPGTLLLPWLLGLVGANGAASWRVHWRARDPRTLLFLGWVVLVVVFFSLSSGKRGVYVLPALPAFVLAVAPLMVGTPGCPGLLTCAGVRRLSFFLTLGAVAATGGGVLWLATVGQDSLQHLAEQNGVASPLSLLWPLLTLAGVGALLLGVCGRRRAHWALAGLLWSGSVLQGCWINPLLDASRSGRAFMQQVEAAVPAGVELGVLNYREQFLLQATRPWVNFGHRRWREGAQEPYDAARWLMGGGHFGAPPRWLLVEGALLDECFAGSQHREIGHAGGQQWFLVTSPSAITCARRGNAAAALRYQPLTPAATP